MRVETIGDCTLYLGDCLDVMPMLGANSVDTVVMDPPAGISFMGKDWDGDKGGRDAWIVWLSDVLRECYRVAKPGAMLLCWAIPRTSHWTGTAIEDAGWEVRDVITHVFGSGFPKSLDISKAIDKAAGAENVVGYGKRSTNAFNDRLRESNGYRPRQYQQRAGEPFPITAPATDDARTWDGWGTALKPAAEFWYLAMKPLDGTFAQNALRWGVAGLAIDKGRIEASETTARTNHAPRFDAINANRSIVVLYRLITCKCAGAAADMLSPS